MASFPTTRAVPNILSSSVSRGSWAIGKSSPPRMMPSVYNYGLILSSFLEMSAASRVGKTHTSLG